MTVATTCPWVILTNMHRKKPDGASLGPPSVAAVRHDVVTLKGRAAPTTGKSQTPLEASPFASNLVITFSLSTRDN